MDDSTVCPICEVGVLWPNSWMDQDATWYGSRPRARRYCVRWGSSSSRRKGAQQPRPLFEPCLLWPNGRPSQQLQSFCSYSLCSNIKITTYCVTCASKSINEIIVSLHLIMAALWNRAGHYIFALWFLSIFNLLLLFFLAWSQRLEIGCLPYYHTWCGLSANLECMSEMCCTRLAEKYRTQKIAILAP